MTLNSANAICVPINSTKPAPSPYSYASPIPQPVAAPESLPFPHPASNPPESLPLPHPASPRPTSDPPKSLPFPHPASDPASDPPKSLPFPHPASDTPSKSIFPILPSLLEAVPQLSHTDDAPIKTICASTDYPEDCISSITPLLHGKTDLISVVGLAIQAATEHTQLAVAAATKIATSPGIPSDMASVIGDCKDSYNDALDNFQKATEALSSSDVGTMNSMLSAAITDFSDNDDSLAGKPYAQALLEFDAMLTKMTSNCLAIVSLIK
ncbi:hypothetical protein Vadar_017762 [Vaccinium darrowii]|uniref:Uncharacterized protein n=1 Tax=Vaccinium darrowii TaxID=229202 RepID=A0ACB7YWC1_9ERIC|nr:hypothetical protein Vadar_017762 [Vaccinium darrowii]